MEDADKNSKSLVLITRVGSTPTTGIKRKPSSLSGGLSFYLRRVSGSNSTTLHSRGAISPAGCCSVRGRPPPPALQAARNRRVLGCFSFYPLTSGPSSHGCLHQETADDVLEGVITEGSGAFLYQNYFRSNRTMTSRYHRYGTMFQIIQSSIRM